MNKSFPASGSWEFLISAWQRLNAAPSPARWAWGGMEMGFILIIPPVQTAISAALPRPGSAQGLLWAWFILPVEIHIPQCTAWCFCTHPIRIVLYTCFTLFSRVVTPIFFWLRKKKKSVWFRTFPSASSGKGEPFSGVPDTACLCSISRQPNPFFVHFLSSLIFVKEPKSHCSQVQNSGSFPAWHPTDPVQHPLTALHSSHESFAATS